MKIKLLAFSPLVLLGVIFVSSIKAQASIGQFDGTWILDSAHCEGVGEAVDEENNELGQQIPSDWQMALIVHGESLTFMSNSNTEPCFLLYSGVAVSSQAGLKVTSISPAYVGNKCQVDAGAELPNALPAFTLSGGKLILEGSDNKDICKKINFVFTRKLN